MPALWTKGLGDYVGLDIGCAERLDADYELLSVLAVLGTGGGYFDVSIRARNALVAGVVAPAGVVEQHSASRNALHAVIHGCVAVLK